MEMSSTHAALLDEGEVDERLHNIMIAIHKNFVEMAETHAFGNCSRREYRRIPAPSSRAPAGRGSLENRFERFTMAVTALFHYLYVFMRPRRFPGHCPALQRCPEAPSSTDGSSG